MVGQLALSFVKSAGEAPFQDRAMCRAGALIITDHVQYYVVNICALNRAAPPAQNFTRALFKTLLSIQSNVPPPRACLPTRRHRVPIYCIPIVHINPNAPAFSL